MLQGDSLYLCSKVMDNDMQSPSFFLIIFFFFHLFPFCVFRDALYFSFFFFLSTKLCLNSNASYESRGFTIPFFDFPVIVVVTASMFHRSTWRLAGNAFMDVAIGHEKPRRISFELFTKKCPVAAENFLKLCTGENVLPRVSSVEGLGEPSFGDQFLPQLTYRNTTFHRVSKGYLVQGGDIVSGNGTHQLSIYGDTFDAPEEVKASKFDKKGLLGTAVSAPHLNGSQFFILTADSAPHLDGTCICFGRVVDGWDVVEEIEVVPLTAAGTPAKKVVIVECGKL